MPRQSRIALLLVALALSTHARTQESTEPQLVERHNGNSVNVYIEGQLAPTQQLDCVEVEQVESKDTPPDILTGVRRCIDAKDYDRAARLEVVALTYARFDAERVADVTARDAGQALAFQFGSALNADQKSGMTGAFSPLVKDGDAHRSLCARMASVGPPTYVPTYMILHSADLIARRMNHLPEPTTEPLVPGFDAAATWNRLKDVYLHCS